jgi:hypothetical protein
VTEAFDSLVAGTVAHLRRASVGGFVATVASSIVGLVLAAATTLVAAPAIYLQLDVFEVRVLNYTRVAGIPVGPLGAENVTGPALALGLGTLIACAIAGALGAFQGRSRLAAARHALLAGAKIALLLAPTVAIVLLTLRMETVALLVGEVAVLLLVLARVSVVAIGGLGVHGQLRRALLEGLRHGRFWLGGVVLAPPLVIAIAAAFPAPFSQTAGSGPSAIVVFLGACLVAVHVLGAGALALRELCVPAGPDPATRRSGLPWVLAVLAFLVLAAEDGVVLSRAREEARLGLEVARKLQAERARIESSTSVEELDAMLRDELVSDTLLARAKVRIERLAYLRVLEGGDAEARAFVARFDCGAVSLTLAPRGRAALIHIAQFEWPLEADHTGLRRAQEELAQALLDSPSEDQRAAGVLIRESLEDKRDWPTVRGRLVWREGSQAGDRRAYETAVSSSITRFLAPAHVTVTLDAGLEIEPALVVALDVQPDASRVFGPAKFPAENLTVKVSVGAWSKTWTVVTPEEIPSRPPSPTDISRATAYSISIGAFRPFPW